MEGITLLMLLAALVLGRWWAVAIPLLLTGSVVIWFALYVGTGGELYGSGEQDPEFWLICTMASWVAALIGVAGHQLVLAGTRAALRLARS